MSRMDNSYRENSKAVNGPKISVSARLQYSIYMVNHLFMTGLGHQYYSIWHKTLSLATYTTADPVKPGLTLVTRFQWLLSSSKRILTEVKTMSLTVNNIIRITSLSQKNCATQGLHQNIVMYNVFDGLLRLGLNMVALKIINSTTIQFHCLNLSIIIYIKRQIQFYSSKS